MPKSKANLDDTVGMPNAKPYDPLDYENLAWNIAEVLLRRPLEPLPPTSFLGLGVYALYYNGTFEHYRCLARMKDKHGREVPIYVGKAVPGGRKGEETDPVRTPSLYQRLKQHARSIEETENLKRGDFSCRYLVLVPVWVTLTEQMLIRSFKPIWNVVVDGFGNHAPGKGRAGMRRPDWDTVHPGRHWAAKLQQGRPEREIWMAVANSLRG